MRSWTVMLLICLLFGVQAGAQTYTLADTLTVIQRPLVNIPALVMPGQDLVISCVAPLGTTGWTARLERGALQIPLEVVGAAHDPATTWWTVAAAVPDVPVFDLYDLRVTASGGLDDRTRHAVRVLPQWRTDFTFVHITDTHLPTYLYYYENGAATDSTTSVGLRTILEDVSIINPEFILLTGDLIHEGELEDYLGRRYYSRAQQLLAESDVPVFLTGGNHDLGGWDSTPPSDGTSRRDWWRFFGWRRLGNPPPGAPARTQDYGFDYGPVHFVGLEAYDNYDNWRADIYGTESYTNAQMSWLQQEVGAASASEAIVLFSHFDFQNELNLPALNIDLNLWGHIHSDTEDATAPFDVSTDNASGSNRPFRVIRWTGGRFDVRPTLDAYTGGNLTTTFTPDNSGTSDTVSVLVHNGYNERFHNALVRVNMPADAPGFLVTGGSLVQVDDTGPVAVCYVEAVLNPASNLTVTVTVDPDAQTGAGDAPHPRLLAAHPNPFNPRTEVAFDLPAAAVCRLTVFDARGCEVSVLADGPLPAGRHVAAWEGRDAAGRPLPSGVYFLGLRAGPFSETRKVTLAR
ncbi:MAG: metallophosphoesterase [Candidatus Latescibacteria bacterium]|nr:metallophosphoesterase [Candidatus Latescibacterota bacterium]